MHTEQIVMQSNHCVVEATGENILFKTGLDNAAYILNM